MCLEIKYSAIDYGFVVYKNGAYLYGGPSLILERDLTGDLDYRTGRPVFDSVEVLEEILSRILGIFKDLIKELQKNGDKQMEYIYDIENYQLLGEINQYSMMGRVSVGYYFDAALQKWAVCQTDATTRAMVIHYDDKQSALEKYKSASDELAEIAGRIQKKEFPEHLFPKKLKGKTILIV